MFRNILLSVIMGLYALSSVSYAVGETKKCSLKTWKGTYFYGGTGLENGKFNADGGVEIYDGNGAMTLVNILSNGQEVVSTGQYTLGEDCIGRTSYNLWKTKYVQYGGPSGKEMTWNSLAGSTKNWSGAEIRTSTSMNVQCTRRTLKGTYIYSVSGYIAGVPYFDSGKHIYDGSGNIRNIRLDSNGNEKATEGTYTFGKYCAGFVKLGNQESFAIYSGPKGDKIHDVSPADASDTMIYGFEYKVSKR